MEHKAVKKAKKGLFSIVFGRTALILMLVLIQLIVLVFFLSVQTAVL